MERKIDKVGRVVIPMEVRKKLRWEEDDILEMEIGLNSITIFKKKKVCSLCEQNPIKIKFGETGICEDCLNKIKSL